MHEQLRFLRIENIYKRMYGKGFQFFYTYLCLHSVASLFLNDLDHIFVQKLMLKPNALRVVLD